MRYLHIKSKDVPLNTFENKAETIPSYDLSLIFKHACLFPIFNDIVMYIFLSRLNNEDFEQYF